MGGQVQAPRMVQLLHLGRQLVYDVGQPSRAAWRFTSPVTSSGG